MWTPGSLFLCVQRGAVEYGLLLYTSMTVIWIHGEGDFGHCRILSSGGDKNGDLWWQFETEVRA